MENENNLLDNMDDSVNLLLDQLKSNGTFDKLRKHCITEVYSKPSFQNWKQRIEIKAKTFLSEIEYTPELNKNTVREELRTHIFNGSVNRDIEEGADIIINQILGKQGIHFFESQIDMACNEFLGIGNEESPIVHYGLDQSSIDMIDLSNIEEISSTILNPEIDVIPDIDNMAYDNIQNGGRNDSKSDQKETSSSLCEEPKSYNGNQSDHTNDKGESSKHKKSVNKHQTSTSQSSSSNDDSSGKDKSCKDGFHKSKVDDISKDIVYKSNDIVEKSKEDVNKPEYANKIYNDVKCIVYKPQDFVGTSKYIKNKPEDVVDGSKNECLSKDSNSSNDDMHICSFDKLERVEEKKPTNSESNDFQSYIMTKHENNKFIDDSPTTTTLKVPTTENELEVKEYSAQTKILQSIDNGLCEVKRPTNSEWNDFQNSIMSNYEKYREHIEFRDDSPTTATLKVPTTENKLEVKQSSTQTKILPSVDKSDDKKNLQSKPLNSVKSVHNNTESNTNHIMFDKKCYVNIERLPCEYIKLHCRSVNNLELTKEQQKPAEIVGDEKELKMLNDEINLDPSVLNTDKSVNTFIGFSEEEAVPCKNFNLLQSVLKKFKTEKKNQNLMDEDVSYEDILPCNQQNNVVQVKEKPLINSFLGFTKEETEVSFGHLSVRKQLQLAVKQQQNMKSDKDGKKRNNALSKKKYNKSNEKNKKDDLTVNNDNEEKWIMEQRIKYNLVPLTVILERCDDLIVSRITNKTNKKKHC